MHGRRGSITARLHSRENLEQPDTYQLLTVFLLPACAQIYPRPYRVTLTREDVEEGCAGVAEGVLSACREALSAAGLAAKDIQDVELLGGGSYIPLLRRSVESTFG